MGRGAGDVPGTPRATTAKMIMNDNKFVRNDHNEKEENMNILTIQATKYLLRSRIVVLFLIVWITSSHTASAAEWHVVRVTENGSKTCRRPMATGVYDATAEKLYVCWSGPAMRPQVAVFDQQSRKIIAVRDLEIPNSSSDDHDYPHIIQSSDGRLHVFYSRHNRSLFQVTAPEPHSINGQWTTREIGSRLQATYPMPISSSSGALYVFYRVTKEPTDYRPLAYVRSTDNGKTWSKPIPAIDHGKTRRTDHLDEIYVGAFTHARTANRLGELFQCTWTLAGGGPKQHKHNVYHKNMYHAYFRPSDGHWLSAAGSDLGTLIDDSIAEKHCKVFDSGAIHGMKKVREPQDVGYISKALSASDGHPVVVFFDGKRRAIAIGRWTGTQWAVSRPDAFKGRRAFMDFYSGAARGEMFVNLRAVRGKSIEVFRSANNGKTWTKDRILRASGRFIRACNAIATPGQPVQLVEEKNDGNSNRIWIATEE